MQIPNNNQPRQRDGHNQRAGHNQGFRAQLVNLACLYLATQGALPPKEPHTSPLDNNRLHLNETYTKQNIPNSTLNLNNKQPFNSTTETQKPNSTLNLNNKQPFNSTTETQKPNSTLNLDVSTKKTLLIELQNSTNTSISSEESISEDQKNIYAFYGLVFLLIHRHHE